MANDKHEWQVINDLFEKHGLPHPPVRLRDQLVTHLVSHREAAAHARAGAVGVNGLPEKLEEIRARVEKTMCQTWSSADGDVGEQGRISREDFDILVLSALAHPAVPEGWQPIETAPKDGTRFLATGGGLANEIEVASWNDRVGAWNTESYTLEDWDNQTEGYSRPAHWMPLPKPPVAAAEKEARG